MTVPGSPARCWVTPATAVLCSKRRRCNLSVAMLTVPHPANGPATATTDRPLRALYRKLRAATVAEKPDGGGRERNEACPDVRYLVLRSESVRAAAAVTPSAAVTGSASRRT